MTECVAVASNFLPAAELAAVLKEYAPALESAGVSLGTAPSARVLFVITGGTEQQVLDIVRRGGGSHREAVVLIAYPGRNSLPASLEVLARLQQDGVPGRIVFLAGPGDTDGTERLRLAVLGSGVSAVDDSVSAAAPARSGGFSSKPPGRPLDGVRIGLIGEPSDWLVASSPDPGLVRDAWGAEVVAIDLAEVVRRMEQDPGTARRFAESFAGGAVECREPTPDDLGSSGHIYVALRSLIEEHQLDALTVRCFDLVTGLGATGCLALSRLTDEGVIAGCEGDLVSALGLLWAQRLTGETPWMANPARIDVASNSLTLAHCTVPCSVVDSYSLRSHFESGLGAAVAGCVPTGPVTLLRIGGKGLDRLWVARGEIVAAGCDEQMCRTQVDVRLVPPAGSADLLQYPLGNHLILVREHHSI